MILLVDQRSDQVLDYKLDEKAIESVILTTLERAGFGPDYEISLSLVDEGEIRELNREYRGMDKVTDVLSFPVYERGDIPESGILGDVIICLKRAGDQAQEYGHSTDREVSYLICHSILHLLGYDHIDEEDKKEMRGLEKDIMKDLGVFK